MFKFCVLSSIPASLIKRFLCISVSLSVLAGVLLIVGVSCTLIGHNGDPCGDTTIYTAFGFSAVCVGTGIAFAVLYSRLKGFGADKILDGRVSNLMIEEDKQEPMLPLTEVDGVVVEDEEEKLNAVTTWIEQQNETGDVEIPYISDDNIHFAVSAKSNQDRIYERAISIDRESYS